jgi:nucleotide-binding universal stress UspA family protein
MKLKRIVVGIDFSSGRLGRAMYGSVTERVLGSADGHVLVVPEPLAARPKAG